MFPHSKMEKQEKQIQNEAKMLNFENVDYKELNMTHQVFNVAKFTSCHEHAHTRVYVSTLWSLFYEAQHVIKHTHTDWSTEALTGGYETSI